MVLRNHEVYLPLILDSRLEVVELLGDWSAKDAVAAGTQESMLSVTFGLLDELEKIIFAQLTRVQALRVQHFFTNQ